MSESHALHLVGKRTQNENSTQRPPKPNNITEPSRKRTALVDVNAAQRPSKFVKLSGDDEAPPPRTSQDDSNDSQAKQGASVATTTSSTATVLDDGAVATNTNNETTLGCFDVPHKVIVSRVRIANEEHQKKIAALGIEDIDFNHDTVQEDEPEYAVAIDKHLREQEAKYTPDPGYMLTQLDLSWRMRGTLNDWLVGVHFRFSLSTETLFLCTNIIDRFLAIQPIPRIQLQLVGIVALLLASKHEEIYTPQVRELRYLCDNAYTVREIIEMERMVIVKLNFELGMPSPIAFLRRISKAEGEQYATRVIGKYFIETTILSDKFVGYAPSLIAAASMWLARKMRKAGEWDTQLQYYSGYGEEELQPCAQALVMFLQTNTRFRSVYKKYNSAQFHHASQYVERHLQELLL